jgi:hypothetical protein
MSLFNAKRLILTLALTSFNFQFHTRIKVSDCDVEVIPNNDTCDVAYEITTVRSVDFFRLRIYLTIGDKDSLRRFRLETNTIPGISVGNLLDEVQVAEGTIDKYYIDNNHLHELLSIRLDTALYDLIVTEQYGEAITLENEENIELEISS